MAHHFYIRVRRGPDTRGQILSWQYGGADRRIFIRKHSAADAATGWSWLVGAADQPEMGWNRSRVDRSLAQPASQHRTIFHDGQRCSVWTFDHRWQGRSGNSPGLRGKDPSFAGFHAARGRWTSYPG